MTYDGLGFRFEYSNEETRHESAFRRPLGGAGQFSGAHVWGALCGPVKISWDVRSRVMRARWKYFCNGQHVLLIMGSNRSEFKIIAAHPQPAQ